MRLSDAIMTGSVVIEKTDWTTYCCCTLAIALLGVWQKPCEPVVERETHPFEWDFEFHHVSSIWKDAACREWPWIRKSFKIPQDLVGAVFTSNLYSIFAIDIISVMFRRVADGKITLEQLVDWVRANEPEEVVNQLQEIVHEPDFARA